MPHLIEPATRSVINCTAVALRTTPGIASILLVGCTALPPQSTPMEVALWDCPGISVTQFDPVLHTELGGFATDSRFAEIAPFLIVIANDTSVDITGIAIEWLLIQEDGRSYPITVYSDSYSLRQDPIVPTGTRRVVGLTGVASAEALTSSRGTYRLPSASQLEALRNAPTLRVTVDAILFDDGVALGTDRSNIRDHITQRTKAANDVAVRFRLAGEAYPAVADILLSELRVTGNATYRRSARSYVQMVRAAPTPASRDAVVSALAALSVPPAPAKLPALIHRCR